MNKFFFFIAFCCSFSASAAIDAKLDAYIEIVATLALSEDTPDNGLGAKICKAGKGSSCYNVTSIGEGICKAGKGSSCHNVTSIGEGICKAGKGSSCHNVTSIGEGICKSRKGSYCGAMTLEKALSLPVVDTEWKWDQFASDNAYGDTWACRGTRTGKFADTYQCSGEIKIDDTWPNN